MKTHLSCLRSQLEIRLEALLQTPRLHESVTQYLAFEPVELVGIETVDSWHRYRYWCCWLRRRSSCRK